MSATATLTRPTQRPHLVLRRVGAVFAGLLVTAVLSTAADAVLHATGVYPPYPQRMSDGLFLLATAYRIVFGIAGGYATARLAPDQPLRHALALGWVGVVLVGAGAAAFWELGPGWYSLAIVAISLPCTWAGARLHAARTRQG
jgi:hypothetical protein